MSENTTGNSRPGTGTSNGATGPASRSGKPGRARTEYQSVNLGGRHLRVAKTLSERANNRRGYYRSCSGNGCPACAGRGRATFTPGTTRTPRRTSGRAERTAKRSKAKRPRRPGLLGALGFRKRTPLRQRMKSWLGKTFATTATTARRGAGAGTSRGGQVVAIGGNPGASWWRCPRCGATEYALTDADTATGRAARHVTENHPGMPFRIDPQ